jgi:hypothetical protein
MSTDHAHNDPQHAVPLRCARLVGTVNVPLEVSDAFRFFTPIGEKEWAPGWDPLFPIPVEDDSQPGTVFEIAHDGVHSVWVVCRRESNHLIHYARVIPGKDAGTIAVRVASNPPGSVATIEYELTALSATAAIDLARFASHYPQFLAEWEQLIGDACLRSTPSKTVKE